MGCSQQQHAPNHRPSAPLAACDSLGPGTGANRGWRYHQRHQRTGPHQQWRGRIRGGGNAGHGSDDIGHGWRGFERDSAQSRGDEPRACDEWITAEFGISERGDDGQRSDLHVGEHLHGDGGGEWDGERRLVGKLSKPHCCQDQRRVGSGERACTGNEFEQPSHRGFRTCNGGAAWVPGHFRINDRSDLCHIAQFCTCLWRHDSLHFAWK